MSFPKLILAMILACSAMACNNRPAVPGERCFTPANNLFANISEICEFRQNTERTCYLYDDNNTKSAIDCAIVNKWQKVMGTGL